MPGACLLGGLEGGCPATSTSSCLLFTLSVVAFIAMPQRPPTPPIVDDAKYLSVVEPYPRRPNMHLQEHRRRFARWIGACIGLEYIPLFSSFYYRLIVGR